MNETDIKVICMLCKEPVDFYQQRHGKAMCDDCEHELNVLSGERFQKNTTRTFFDIQRKIEEEKLKTIDLLADQIINRLYSSRHRSR